MHFSPNLVIARSDSDEAIQIPAQAALDCFAALAMTKCASLRQIKNQNSHRPSEPLSEPSERSARSGRQIASAFANSAGAIACLRSQ